MTTPDVPLSVTLTFELPGSPEQVWDAIATANGISSWLLPTQLDGRVGGDIRLEMGDDMTSEGTVTAWEPPRRFAYQEDWASLTGHPDAPVTPMVSEFVVEATSGGTCVLRVVTSAFGTGADWEQEFFDDMVANWMPYFDNLRLYLTHFPGQQVTSLYVATDRPGPVAAAWASMRTALGVDGVGHAVDVAGVEGQVERLSEPPAPHELMVRTTKPVPGFLVFTARGDDEKATATIEGFLFSDAAPGRVDEQKAAWSQWLQGLSVPAR